MSRDAPHPLVPAELRCPLTLQLHGLAHPRTKSNVRLVADRFFWPNLAKDVHLWAAACVPYQRANVHCHVRAPLDFFPLPGGHFHHIYVDLVGPLPPSRGFTYLLTMVDRYTRWPEEIPRQTSPPPPSPPTCSTTGWPGSVCRSWWPPTEVHSSPPPSGRRCPRCWGYASPPPGSITHRPTALWRGFTAASRTPSRLDCLAPAGLTSCLGWCWVWGPPSRKTCSAARRSWSMAPLCPCLATASPPDSSLWSGINCSSSAKHLAVFAHSRLLITQLPVHLAGSCPLRRSLCSYTAMSTNLHSPLPTTAHSRSCSRWTRPWPLRRAWRGCGFRRPLQSSRFGRGGFDAPSC